MLSTDLPRIQPHDEDAERAVLSAILLDKAALSKAQELISANDFYDGLHRQIFKAMETLARDGEGIDLVAVGDVLDQAGEIARVGGRAGLAEITGTVASSAGIGHHCRIVRDHAVRRKLIRMTARISEGAYERRPANHLLDDAGRDLLALSTNREERGWYSMAHLASETVQEIDQRSKRSGELTGIPTGFPTLDTFFGGWQPSDLIVVAARPGMGKTSLALGCALAAAENGHHVGFLSLEMSRKQLGLRLHSMSGSIDLQALRNGTLMPLGWQQLAATAQHLQSLRLHVDDTPLLSPDRVAAKARCLKASTGLDLLILDYLQLLELPDAETRQQGVADASRRLKLLAKELEIPILALSQLSRACENRPDRRPMLSDLRDSGGIEQDADVVLFIYREEVYTPDTEEKGVAEVLVRKHRNGPTGDRTLRFIDQYSRFGDWS